jgi:hypothetical protein
MSSPDPTRRPGVFQGPADSDPQPIRPFVVAEDEMAAYFDRLDAEEAGWLRRARRRRLLTRLGIALVGLGVALLLAVAAVHLGRQPSPPTTVPAPVTVPAPGATDYVPVPAGKP